MPKRFKNVLVRIIMRVGSVYLRGEKRCKFIFSNIFTAHPDTGERKAFLDWININQLLSCVEFGRINWRGSFYIIHKSNSVCL